MPTYPYSSTLIMSLGGEAQIDCGTGLSSVFAGDTSFTLEAWVRVSDTSGTQMIMADYDPSTSSGLAALAIRNGKFAARRLHWLASVTEPEKNQWYHVAFSYSAVTDQATLYINGVLEAAQPEIALNSGPSGSLWLGGASGDSNRLQGDLRNAAVWSVSRSQSEIKQDMTAVPSAGTSGLAAWISFDQNPIADVSGNNVPAQVTGALSGTVETTCLKLSGSEYGTTGDSSSLDFSGTQPFTIETMVLLNEVPGSSTADTVLGRFASDGSVWSQYLLKAQAGSCGSAGRGPQRCGPRGHAGARHHPHADPWNPQPDRYCGPIQQR